MLKILSFIFFVGFATQCDLENETNTNLLVVAEGETVVHESTKLQIQIKLLDTSEIGNLLEGNEDFSELTKSLKLDKVVICILTLPDGTIQKKWITDLQIPDNLIDFKANEQTYTVRVESLENDTFAQQATFKIIPIKK